MRHFKVELGLDATKIRTVFKIEAGEVVEEVKNDRWEINNAKI